jgi:hypothetical protein
MKPPTKEWINSLQVGDKVVIVSDYGRKTELAEVSRISPTGSRITTTKGIFTASGNEFESGGYGAKRLVMATQEELDRAQGEDRLRTRQRCIQEILTGIRNSLALCTMPATGRSVETIDRIWEELLMVEASLAQAASKAHAATLIHD